MNSTKLRWCWRKDLAAFRGLSDQDKTGYLLVLEWFENFRLRNEREANREAARVFWKTEVLREGAKWLLRCCQDMVSLSLSRRQRRLT